MPHSLAEFSEVSFYKSFCKEPKFHRSVTQNTFFPRDAHIKTQNGLKTIVVKISQLVSPLGDDCSDSCHGSRCPGMAKPPCHLASEGDSGLSAEGLQTSECTGNELAQGVFTLSPQTTCSNGSVSSCMGGTFRAPRPKGAPFVCINVSPSIKTDIKYLNTKRPGLSCKSHCKKIVCYYSRPLKTIQSKT